MLLLYYILCIKFSILYSYEIIDISPYERKTVYFRKLKSYYIFKYKHMTLEESGNSYFSIRSVEKSNLEYQFFVYLKEKDINEINGTFIDYDKYGNAKDYYIFSDCINHEYYIVVKSESYKENTFYFFSTDSPYEIKDIFSNYYLLSQNIDRQSYVFSISNNIYKYIKFGLTNYGNYGKSLTKVTNKEDNNETLYETDNYIYTDYFELTENITYYFNFSLFYSNASSNSLYFLYLIKSKYSNIIEVTKNYNYYQSFPVIDGLNLLLDVSSTPKGFKIIFEYDYSWYYKGFEADGYNIDNIDIINSLYEDKNVNYAFENSNNNNLESFSHNIDIINRIYDDKNVNYNVFENSNNNNLESFSHNKDSIENGTNIRIPLIVKKEYCYEGRMCKGYIIKNNINLKKIILKIPEGGKNLRYINFRYREEEGEREEENEKKAHRFQNTFLFTCLISLALSFPNILWQLIRKLRNKMTASAFTLIMNIILNFGYGNFFGYTIFDYGEKASMILGIVLLSLYGFLCFVSLIMQCCGKRAYFDVIFNLCHKLDNSKSLNEMISINRKLFPSMKVGCYAQHEESREVWEEQEPYNRPVYKTVRQHNGEFREVLDHYEKDYRHVRTHYSRWDRVDRGGGHFNHCPGNSRNKFIKNVEYRTVETWRKELEYVYKSWQDNTTNIENIKYCSIVEATFSCRFSFDHESQTIMSRMKDGLYAEGKKHDTDVHTYDNFTVPGFHNKHTCPLNESEYQRIQKNCANCCGYLFWFILFLLGYSSIFEAYSRYEIGKEHITIYKYVSNKDNMRMPYKTKEIDLPGITISFVHTKLQMKSLEKKLEEGKIDKKDIDIPLILVN